MQWNESCTHEPTFCVVALCASCGAARPTRIAQSHPGLALWSRIRCLCLCLYRIEACRTKTPSCSCSVSSILVSLWVIAGASLLVFSWHLASEQVRSAGSEMPMRGRGPSRSVTLEMSRMQCGCSPQRRALGGRQLIIEWVVEKVILVGPVNYLTLTKIN
jgi:hypothetical protein